MSHDLTASMPALTEVNSDTRELIFNILSQLVEPLAQALGPAEVIVHDLSNLDASVKAISGNLTGRSPGDPATNLLIRLVKAGAPSHVISYRTELPGHRDALSSTIIVRDPSDGSPVAALCFNVDISELAAARDSITRILDSYPTTPDHSGSAERMETFPSSVHELLDDAVRNAIKKVGIEVALMKKPHKLTVVSELADRGVFQIRDAVEFVAEKLDVSRFTIYNYLNEIEAESE
ncbi:helix-turn-helix transcriptional regulator [Arthrobacter sp. HLT1-20]